MPSARPSMVGLALSGAGLMLTISLAHAQTGGVTLLDAVRSTLARHPGIMIQQEAVNASRGRREQAAAPFDSLAVADLLQSRANTPLRLRDRTTAVDDGLRDVSHQATDLTTLNVGATRLLRNGLALNLGSSVERTADNLSFDTGVTRSFTRAGVTVPLFGGRGRAVVAAEEAATDAEIRADQMDLQQTIARLVANTSTSYWTLAAAKRQLEIAAISEDRGRRLRDNVQTLIEADRSPQDDIHNVAANLAERIGGRILAEQRVIDRRRALAVDMGLDAGSLAAFPDTLDPLPDAIPTAAPALDDATVRCFVDTALRDRPDLRAAQARVEAAQARLPASRDLLRPRVDASLSVGYAGMREGLAFGDSLRALQGGRGLDLQVGLSYTQRSRHFGAGATMTATAEIAQADLRRRDLEREIRASVVSALTAVQNSLARLAVVAESVDGFQRALVGQQEKLRLGVASVVELLTVEDRLTSAQLLLADAQAGYPQAVTQLLLITGALAPADRPVAVTEPALFLRMPACVAAPAGTAAAAGAVSGTAGRTAVAVGAARGHATAASADRAANVRR